MGEFPGGTEGADVEGGLWGGESLPFPPEGQVRVARRCSGPEPGAAAWLRGQGDMMTALCWGGGAVGSSCIGRALCSHGETNIMEMRLVNLGPQKCPSVHCPHMAASPVHLRLHPPGLSVKTGPDVLAWGSTLVAMETD